MRKSIVQLINKPYTIKSKTIAGSTVTQTGKAWQLAAEVVIGAAIGIVGAKMMQPDSTTWLLDTPFEEETKRELEQRLEQLRDELETTQVLLDMEKQENELLNHENGLLNQENELLNHENGLLNQENELLREMEKDLMSAASRMWQLEEEIDTANDLLDIATRENEGLNEELNKLRRIQEDAAWREIRDELNTESVNDNEVAIASSTIPATPWSSPNAAAVADGEDSYW